MLNQLSTLRFTHDNGIYFIEIKGENANKMSLKFLGEFSKIVSHITNKEDVKGIILTGHGRHFSSGSDISELLNIIVTESGIRGCDVKKVPKLHNDFKKSLETIQGISVPVVASITGFCIGSGFEIALSAHIKICEKGARLGLPESTFGLMPGVNGSINIAKKLGIMNSFEFIIKGSLYNEKEVYELELIDDVVTKKSSLRLAIEFVNYVYENNVAYCNKNSTKIYREFISHRYKG